MMNENSTPIPLFLESWVVRDLPALSYHFQESTGNAREYINFIMLFVLIYVKKKPYLLSLEPL